MQSALITEGPERLRWAPSLFKLPWGSFEGEREKRGVHHSLSCWSSLTELNWIALTQKVLLSKDQPESKDIKLCWDVGSLLYAASILRVPFVNPQAEPGLANGCEIHFHCYIFLQCSESNFHRISMDTSVVILITRGYYLARNLFFNQCVWKHFEIQMSWGSPSHFWFLCILFISEHQR